MCKIVFFCIPAYGHTNPTLAVVRELTARGHQVWYYSYEAFRGQIEEAGAKFIPCDAYGTEQKLTAEEAARVGKDLVLSMRVLTDTTLALDEKVCRDMKELQPDCIVADSMAVWGKAVAGKLKLPFVSSTTTFAFNRYSAKIMKRSFGETCRMLLAMPKANQQVRRLQAHGYPVKNILDILQNDAQTETIVYTSPEFQPCAETFSEKYTFIGPLVREASDCVKKEREKLIYISMGTVNNRMLEFYKNCIDAFADTDYQVILSVGKLISREELGAVPENISVFPFVDQIAVLKQANVFVSHCGMNSVNESLYYQVPLVMVPQTAEQQGVAERVLQLGAGIRLQKTDAAAIDQGVRQVLADASYRKQAAKISEGFRRCPGAKGAADKILRVCKKIP